MPKEDGWKTSLTEMQRKTLVTVLRFMRDNLGTRIKTGSNAFDCSACEIAIDAIEDVLAEFDVE